MNPIVPYINLFHEAEKFAEYSSAVHKAIGTVNVVVLAMLQVVNQHYHISRIKASIYFGVLIIYTVLGVGEVMCVQLQLDDSVIRLIGHVSHFTGALAAIGVISMVNVAFACVTLAMLLSVWIPAVILTEKMGTRPGTTDSRLPV